MKWEPKCSSTWLFTAPFNPLQYTVKKCCNSQNYIWGVFSNFFFLNHHSTKTYGDSKGPLRWGKWDKIIPFPWTNKTIESSHKKVLHSLSKRMWSNSKLVLAITWSGEKKKKKISIHVNAKYFWESNTFCERMQRNIEIIILIFPHHCYRQRRSETNGMQ